MAAGGEKVAVAPRLMFEGLSFMAGTAGEVYPPVVGESPDPPARSRRAWVGPRFTAIATPMAPMPNVLANDLIRVPLNATLPFGAPQSPWYARRFQTVK